MPAWIQFLHSQRQQHLRSRPSLCRDSYLLCHTTPGQTVHCYWVTSLVWVHQPFTSEGQKVIRCSGMLPKCCATGPDDDAEYINSLTACFLMIQTVFHQHQATCNPPIHEASSCSWSMRKISQYQRKAAYKGLLYQEVLKLQPAKKNEQGRNSCQTMPLTELGTQHTQQ